MEEAEVVAVVRFIPYLLKDGQFMVEIMGIQEVNQEQVVLEAVVEWAETLLDQGQELQMLEMVVQVLVDRYLSTLYSIVIVTPVAEGEYPPRHKSRARFPKLSLSEQTHECHKSKLSYLVIQP